MVSSKKTIKVFLTVWSWPKVDEDVDFGAYPRLGGSVSPWKCVTIFPGAYEDPGTSYIHTHGSQTSKNVMAGKNLPYRQIYLTLSKYINVGCELLERQHTFLFQIVVSDLMSRRMIAAVKVWQIYKVFKLSNFHFTWKFVASKKEDLWRGWAKLWKLFSFYKNDY